MYCKKCGKFFYGDAELCPECLAVEESVSSEPSNEDVETIIEEVTTYTEEPKKTVNIRLGKSIAALVLSNVGLFLVYIGLIIMETFLQMGTGDYAVGTVFALLGLVPCILGLIFGIQSISYYRSLSNVKSGKKIPVLIFGIVSTVVSGIAIFCNIICLLASMLV